MMFNEREFQTGELSQWLSGKELPAVQEMWVQSLGQEDPPGKGNGNPLQYSSLGNPADRRAWWATVPGATKDLGMTYLLNNNSIPDRGFTSCKDQ